MKNIQGGEDDQEKATKFFINKSDKKKPFTNTASRRTALPGGTKGVDIIF